MFFIEGIPWLITVLKGLYIRWSLYTRSSIFNFFNFFNSLDQQADLKKIDNIIAARVFLPTASGGENCKIVCELMASYQNRVKRAYVKT